MSESRIRSQENTPKSWILDGLMFRILSWEIEKEEIEELIDSLIGKGNYSINQIRSKNGELKSGGITLLYVKSPEDSEKIRTTLLITSSGTELRKIPHSFIKNIETKTIKTTAPLWITKEKILDVFSKYNTDQNVYDMKIEGKLIKGVKYPLVRFYPTIVDRNSIKTKVNIIYVEYSPKSECKNDSFIALSLEHRCKFYNKLSKEEAVLVFDKWVIEKPIKDVIKEKIKSVGL